MKSAVVSPVKAIAGVDTVFVIYKNYELVRGLTSHTPFNRLLDCASI